MCGYAKADTELARRGYDQAMQRSRELRSSEPRKRTLSLDELLERMHKAA